MASEALDEERKKYQATLSKEERVHVKKSIRWLTLKRPGSLNAAELKALAAVRETIPELGKAYDFKEAFFRIYDDPDKASAQHAFEAWENTLPEGELAMFSRRHVHLDGLTVNGRVRQNALRKTCPKSGQRRAAIQAFRIADSNQEQYRDG